MRKRGLYDPRLTKALRTMVSMERFQRLTRSPRAQPGCRSPAGSVGASLPAGPHPGTGQALLTRSVSNYCWAGPCLPSAVSQVKALPGGRFIRIDLDKENLASVALRAYSSMSKCNFSLKKKINLQKGF